MLVDFGSALAESFGSFILKISDKTKLKLNQNIILKWANNKIFILFSDFESQFATFMFLAVLLQIKF